jgi:hypothetical protein
LNYAILSAFSGLSGKKIGQVVTLYSVQVIRHTYKVLVATHERKHNLKDLGIGGRIILKWTLKGIR